MSMRRNTGRARRGGGMVDGFPPKSLDYNFDVANVTKDGSDIISQVVDLSGNARHLTNGVSARRPLWVNNADPSATQDIGRFAPDGVNIKSMTNSPGAALFTLTGYTVFLALNRTAGAAAHALFYYNTGAARGGWSLEISGTATRQFNARTSAGVVKGCTFGSYTNNTPEIWTIRNKADADDTDSSAYFSTRVNGAAVAYTGSPWFWIPTTHSIFIGNATATAGPVVDKYAARAYAGYLTDAQCLTVERELGATYGITVA